MIGDSVAPALHFPPAVSAFMRSMHSWLISFVIGIALCVPVTRSALAADEFESIVEPILKKNCFQCHSSKAPKGDVRLDTLSRDMVHDRAAMETWHDALTAIQLGEMPPDDATALSSADRKMLLGWIRKNVDSALASIQGSAQGIVMRRLNRAEYAYTMTDLLGLRMDYAADLPPDPISKDGFLNNGQALGMSSMQLQVYLRSARQALDMVLVEGDRPDQVTETIQQNKGFNLKKVTADNSDQLGRAQHWIGTSSTLPADGPFTVRVTARTNWQKGKPVPRLGLRFGYFVGGLTTQFLNEVGEVKIDSNESVTVEFKGRCEFLPKPEPSIPRDKLQTLFVLTNTLDDAEPRPNQITVKEESDPGAKDAKKKPRKRKPKKVFERDPEFPQIYVESVEFVMQDYESWPPAGHRSIVPDGEDLDQTDSVRRVLETFLSRAWRRPATDQEIDVWTEHFARIRTASQSNIQALRETLAASLASTPFLYLVEPQDTSNQPRRLNPYELASRLSYFLWSSTPDDELSALAESGDLLDMAILGEQFDRMMSDPKSERFVDQFCTQWLDLDSLQRVAVNPQYYKNFDDDLKIDMVAETKHFFNEILRSDLSAMHLLESDFTMLNAALAKHYGLSGPNSQDFVRVSLNETKRPGGLLGHAATHMAGSDGVDSHPIKRAVWIRERLLHDPPDPPPPDVPDIQSTVKDFQKLTVREQLEVHREKAACADCHRAIDPWGIALEHYDAIGLHREKIARKRKPVDAKTILPGNHPVQGVRELQRHLIEKRKGQFAEAIVAKLATYAVGRSLELVDQKVIDGLAGRFADNDYRLAPLMREIVTCELFLNR